MIGHPATTWRTWAVLATMAAAGPLAASAQAPTAAIVSMPLYIITLRPGPAWQAGIPMAKQSLGAHAAYWRALVAAGHAFAAGGFSTSEGGLAIVIAPDLAAARDIMTSDPATTSGVFIATIERWTPSFRTDRALPTR